MARQRGLTLGRAGLGVLAGAALVTFAVAVARLRPAVRAVRPDLRTPWLYVPVWAPRTIDGPLNRLALAAARRLLRSNAALRRGVNLERRHATVRGGSRGVEVLLYEARDRRPPSGALLWVHGGGLVAGGPEQDHDLCSGLAADAGVLVAGVDYRLAPEHPFPAGLDDCGIALEWLHEQAGVLGIDARRIAVGGSSAGGALAAGLVQWAHDRGRLPVAFQLLVYPMLDDRTSLRADDHDDPDRSDESVRSVRGRIGWTPTTNRFGWTAYLGHAPGPEPPPYAAPARRADLRGLPPAWMGVADLDLLHDEDVDYATRLQAAGVPCALHVEQGMYHGADAGSSAPSMRAFRGRMAAALRAAVGEPDAPQAWP